MVVEGALEGELDDHLGYGKNDPAGRNGGIPATGTSFRTAAHAALVFRGRSGRPLYVTAAGMTIADAAHLVGAMAGSFRMPDALKRADRLARGLERPQVAHRLSDAKNPDSSEPAFPDGQ